MEHPGGVTGLTPGVTAWTAESIASLPPGERRTMAALVDEAGARSARAQALPTAITSTVRERKVFFFLGRTARSFFFGDDASLSFRRRRRAEISSNARRRRPNDDRAANTRHTKRKALPNAVHVELTVRIFLFFFQSRRTSAHLRVPPAPYIKKTPFRSVPLKQDRLTRDQIVYLCCDETTNPLRGPTRVLGILKTGDKNLFIHRPSSPKPIEMEPRCVLDFYVAENAQRRGVGFLLFAFFLRNENKHPARLAYDRPSAKFLAFLRKHHGLVTYQTQTNNFVVFDAYFAVTPRPASAAREARKLAEGRGVGLAAAARAKAAAARAAREEASARDAKRREDARLLAVSSSSSRASSEVFLSRSDDGSFSSELRDEERRGLARRAPPRGASDGPSRESGIASSFSSRYKRPGRRFAERRDAGMTRTDYPYGSRDADAAKGSRRFVSTNENEKNASNADDDARDGERLSPKPPPAFVPKPPRRATPPDVESDDLRTTNERDVSSSHDPPPRLRLNDASSAGGSRSSTAYDPSSSMSRDSTMTSFPSSSTDASFSRKPPSLRDTSYASFVRGVREMGRATLRDGDERASKTNAFSSLGETLGFATADGVDANDGLKAATVTAPAKKKENVTAQSARGEYGQFVPPREGYYRARSFVKLRRAPTYHFASDAAPFLPSTNGSSQNARLHDQTIRFAERPIGRFPETRGGIPSFERGHTGVHSYGAQQDLFLRRRAAFERAEATARGDKRFGDFRILSADDDDAISSETRFRHRGAAGSSASRRLARLAPLYGDGRYYGADALTRRARLAAAPSAEPELVRVGRRAMAENF